MCVCVCVCVCGLSHADCVDKSGTEGAYICVCVFVRACMRMRMHAYAFVFACDCSVRVNRMKLVESVKCRLHTHTQNDAHVYQKDRRMDMTHRRANHKTSPAPKRKPIFFRGVGYAFYPRIRIFLAFYLTALLLLLQYILLLLLLPVNVSHSCSFSCCFSVPPFLSSYP